MDVCGFPLSFNPSKSLAQISTQSTTSGHSWDTNHFPLDLSEEIKLTTLSPHPSVLLNWDIPEAPPIQHTFLGWRKWHQMLFKCNFPSSSDRSFPSTSSCNQRLPPAWEMPVSKREGLGFYKGMKLETPITAFSVVHPSFRKGMI